MPASLPHSASVTTSGPSARRTSSTRSTPTAPVRSRMTAGPRRRTASRSPSIPEPVTSVLTTHRSSGRGVSVCSAPPGGRTTSDDVTQLIGPCSGSMTLRARTVRPRTSKVAQRLGVRGEREHAGTGHQVVPGDRRVRGRRREVVRTPVEERLGERGRTQVRGSRARARRNRGVRSAARYRLAFVSACASPTSCRDQPERDRTEALARPPAIEVDQGGQALDATELRLAAAAGLELAALSRDQQEGDVRAPGSTRSRRCPRAARSRGSARRPDAPRHPLRRDPRPHNPTGAEPSAGRAARGGTTRRAGA